MKHTVIALNQKEIKEVSGGLLKDIAMAVTTVLFPVIGFAVGTGIYLCLTKPRMETVYTK